MCTWAGAEVAGPGEGHRSGDTAPRPPAPAITRLTEHNEILHNLAMIKITQQQFNKKITTNKLNKIFLLNLLSWALCLLMFHFNSSLYKKYEFMGAKSEQHVYHKLSKQ